MSAIALSLDYRYRYLFPSGLEAEGAAARLRLATCGGPEPNPFFFRGLLRKPEEAADLLRGLAEVVDARFCVPASMLGRILRVADPVVTSSEGALRFEAFSQCCGVYARVDLLPGSFTGEVMGRGTTNVDFNPPMRAGLARIRAGDRVGLNIGADAMELTRASETIQERSVALPVRWLKGFVEALACQARMEPMLAVSGAQAHRFLREVPRGAMKEAWIAPVTTGLRLSQRPGESSIRVAGVQRLRVLERLSRHARRLCGFRDAITGASAWELDCGDARFTLALSPETWRGFSGEGQALDRLARGGWQKLLPRVRAALTWNADLDAAALARRLNAEESAITAALTVLGTRGLVGFDLSQGSYFQRVLPFDLSLVEKLQPRLAAARKLVASGGVTRVIREGERVEAFVRGSGVEHHVRLGESGSRCTCPWFAKYRGDRGPCKHVLAVQIMLEEPAQG